MIIVVEIDLKSPEYMAIFIEEISEIIERLERQLVDYEDSKNEELNKSIKRDFHTLKGDFTTYSMKENAEFFHNVETMWIKPENRKEGLITKVLEQISKIKKELKLCVNGVCSEDNKEMDIGEAEVNGLKEENEKLYEIMIDFKGESVKEFNISELKGVCTIDGKLLDYSYITDKIPEMTELDPDMLYIKIRMIVKTEDISVIKNSIEELIESQYISIREISENEISVSEESVSKEETAIIREEFVEMETVQSENHEAKAEKTEGKEENKEMATIRVNTEKLDNLVNIVGELIVSHSSLRTFKEFIAEHKVDDFEKLISDLDNVTKSMQEDVLAVRMIPVGNTFVQFKRMIRDLSKKMDKKVKFDIKGGETEIDKTIIEKIVDPLRHMIRNSVDHGIETAEERVAAGKDPEGTIKLTAWHQGGEVMIEIADDGKGLDKEKIIEKAVAKKLMSPNVNMSDEDIYALIFEPGFSTKESVTEVSGRGVGMDVVKNNISELGGKVEIESERGKYSRFKIRLPLTLAIIDGMLVKVGEQIYAIPILSIVESLQPKEKAIKNVKGKSDILEIRGEYYPLVRLGEQFKLKGAIKDPTKATVIVVDTYKGQMALMVDEVVDNQQIVIKKINLNYKELGKFSGATILGNGEVALILDIKGIYDGIMKKSAGGENDEQP